MFSAELPWDSNLVEGLRGTLNPGSSYTQITSAKKDSKGDDFVFLIGHNNISYGSTDIPNSGNGTIILKFSNTNGSLLWWQQMGNESNSAWVNSVLETNEGKFQILGGCSFSTGKTLTLGNQSFSYTANGTARFFTATFNPADYTWSNVKFIINPDENNGYIEEVKQFLDNDGNYFLGGKFSAGAILVDNDTIAKRTGNQGINIFTTKFSSAMVRQWSKYSKVVNSGTYLHNVFFDSDGNGGAIIAGSLGYITGGLSFDDKVVKNDTLSSTYDYSYQDIFIVNIGSTGTVNYAKTLLNSGNENITFLKSTGDGKLYLCGEYSGKMNVLSKNFPALGNSTYYNDFLGCINAANGNFIWAEPINSNIYYSERQRFFDVDKNNDLYFSTRFANANVNLFGGEYVKRHNANNIVIGKVNKTGEKQWINVLSAITTFSGIIEHTSITSLYAGSYLFISVPRRSYGSNKDIGWGSLYEPETTMYMGYDGNTLVINPENGKMISGSTTRFPIITENNNNDFTGIFVDYMEYKLYNLSLTGAEISGKVSNAGNIFSPDKFGSVQLLNATNNSGKIYQSQPLPEQGEFKFSRIPKGEYIINFASKDSTLTTHYYKAGTDQPILKWNDATKILADNNKSENLNFNLLKTPYPKGNNTVFVNVDISKMFDTSLWYFLNFQCRLFDKSSNQLVAFAYPAEFMNETYGFIIRNVPAGDYRLMVEHGFITQIDVPELKITDLSAATIVNMNIQNDKLYRNISDGLEINKIDNLQIYPNPASDYFRLSREFMQPYNLQIYSAEGKLVKDITDFVSDKIFIKDLKVGIYFVRVDNFWGRFIKR